MSEKEKIEELMNKPTTSEEEKKELEKYLDEQREKRKAVTDQVLRFLGLMTAIVLFFVSFDIFYEMSWFGAIFTRADHLAIWEVMWLEKFEGGLRIYDDWFNFDVWLPITMITMLMVLLATAMAFLISYYIKDLFTLIARFVDLGRGVGDEIGSNFKKGLDEGTKSLNLKRRKDKKGLFEDDEEEVAQPKPDKKREKAEKMLKDLGVPLENGKKVEDLSDADLDAALTGAAPKKAEEKPAPAPQAPKKNLF